MDFLELNIFKWSILWSMACRFLSTFPSVPPFKEAEQLQVMTQILRYVMLVSLAAPVLVSCAFLGFRAQIVDKNLFDCNFQNFPFISKNQ